MVLHLLLFRDFLDEYLKSLKFKLELGKVNVNFFSIRLGVILPF